MLERKIGCFGPQRGWPPWATRQMTNDDRSFTLPIIVSKNLFRQVFVVPNSCFQLQVSHCYS